MKFPKHESSKLEFKATIPKNEQIINTVIAFCNMHGGKLVIGVADNGEIIGIPEREAYAMIEKLSDAIYNSCAPPLLPQIYLQNIDGKYLVVLDVSSGTQKPYYKRKLGLENGTYIRLGTSTVKATADVIEELKLQARGKYFDQTIVHHAQENDLDKKKIENFLSSRRNGAKVIISDAVLKAYEIIIEQHAHIYPSVCGLLLFGNEPQKFLTESYVLCSRFSGITGREAKASKVCNGTIFEQFDGAYDFIVSQLHKAYTIKTKRREETLEMPPIAIREALMNALLHRNYNIKAPIKVAIYDNRVEIFNPGVFPGPIDLDNLDSGITYTRNVAIAKILWEFGFIEKMGSGFITIFKSFKDAGLVTPEIIEGTNFVKCTLYRKLSPSDLEKEHEKILNLFQKYDEISRSDIVKLLDIPKTSAGRLLGDLVESARIEKIGGGRSTRYTLKEK